MDTAHYTYPPILADICGYTYRLIVQCHLSWSTIWRYLISSSSTIISKKVRTIKNRRKRKKADPEVEPFQRCVNLLLQRCCHSHVCNCSLATTVPWESKKFVIAWFYGILGSARFEEFQIKHSECFCIWNAWIWMKSPAPLFCSSCGRAHFRMQSVTRSLRLKLEILF